MVDPLILISNDDGINALSLDLLAASVLPLGKVVIVAPATQQSGMGRSYPRSDKTGVITKRFKKIAGQKIESYAVSGSPAMVIGHAMTEILNRKPDTCLTGINPGENIGSTMTGSGTVMAALEASSFNLPAIAFSMVDLIIKNSKAIDYWSKKITKKILNEGLPQIVSALNVNFPLNLKTNTPVDFTRLSNQTYYEFATQNKRNFSKPHNLDITKILNRDTLEEDGDIYSLLIRKHISITPISWDLTAKIGLNDLANHYSF